MEIPELKRFQRRHRKGTYFQDLPANLRPRAHWWLKRFVERRQRSRKRISPWLFAIYVGQAKRLTLHPPSSEWGRSMLAKRGGYAVQRRYRWDGRHPTKKATHVRLIRQKSRAKEQELPKLPGETVPPSSALEGLFKPLIFRQRPDLPPPPSPEAHLTHLQYDPPGCECYYCAWPNHKR